jgi:hypothetical protein
MGIQRSFTVECDKCGAYSDEPARLATTIRDRCKSDGWTISGNKFTCPVCNKRNPEYWTNLGYHAPDAVIEVS